MQWCCRRCWGQFSPLHGSIQMHTQVNNGFCWGEEKLHCLSKLLSHQNSCCPIFLSATYLRLNCLLLTHELRPQNEDFLLTYFQLLTDRGHLIQEDPIRWGTGGSDVRSTLFHQGLPQLVQLILEFLILGFKLLALKQRGRNTNTVALSFTSNAN